MITAQLTEVNMTPSFGALLGSAGSASVLAAFNNESGGVIFGQANDPYASRYQNFIQQIYGAVEATNKLVHQTAEKLFNRDKVKRIQSEEDLNAIPPCMQYGILTYAPIRAYLENDLIYGFGIDASDLPKEDTVGRLINNGTIKVGDPAVASTEITWEYRTGDPEFSFDQLYDFDVSREYVLRTIKAQLMNGERRDPTDWADGGQIGKLK